jgi:hypothetical protein
LYRNPEMRGPWLGTASFITTFYPSRDPLTIAGYSWTAVLDMGHSLSVPLDILPFLRILAQAPNLLCELIYPDNVPQHSKELEILIWAILRRWTWIAGMGKERRYVHDVSAGSGVLRTESAAFFVVLVYDGEGALASAWPRCGS